MLRKQELGGASRKKVGLDAGMAGAVPLAFACAGVSGDVEEAGIRWGQPEKGGPGRWHGRRCAVGICVWRSERRC